MTDCPVLNQHMLKNTRLKNGCISISLVDALIFGSAFPAFPHLPHTSFWPAGNLFAGRTALNLPAGLRSNSDTSSQNNCKDLIKWCP